jgi:predicted DNA-binding transcriptional regulator AlpA
LATTALQNGLELVYRVLLMATSETSNVLPQTPLLIGAEEAARMLGICRSSFLAADKTGEIGPQSVRIGGRRLWVLDELKAWALAGCPARQRWAAIWQQMTKGNGCDRVAKGPTQKKSEIHPELSLPSQSPMLQ